MVDYQNWAIELNITKKKVEDAFAELAILDYQRTGHFHDYFKKNAAEDLGRFRNETISSAIRLQEIEKGFHQMLGYVLLIEKEGHKHHSFKDLLQRVRYIEQLLHAFFQERKKQVRITRSLLSATDSFSGRVMSFVHKKRLILSLGKEKNLVAVFVGVFKHEQERIKAIFQAYEHENRKDLAMAGMSLTVTVLVPMVGTALGLAVYAALQWANKSSPNYKKLSKLLKSEGKDGPAV